MEALNWVDPQSLDDYQQPQYQSHTTFPTPPLPPTQQPYPQQPSPFPQTLCVAPQNLPLFRVDGGERGETNDIEYDVFDRHEEATSAIYGQHPWYQSTHSQYNLWSPSQGGSHGFANGTLSTHQPAEGLVVQQPAPYNQHLWMPPTSEYPNQDHPAHLPFAHGLSDWAQTPVQASMPPTKPPRAKRACIRCRQRKQRCDKKRPCLLCKKNDIPCVYSSSSAAKGYILFEEGTKQEIERLRETIAVQGEVIERLKRERRDVAPTTSSSETLSRSEGFTPSGYGSGLDSHRTAPDELIRLWPSVWDLFRAAGIDVESGYTSTAEDRTDLYVYEATEDRNDPDSRFSGDERVSHSDRSRLSFTGGVNIGGCLELSATMMNKYFASFMERIYIMHPFVDTTDLRNLFDDFLARYGPTPQHSHSGGVHDESDLRWRCQRPTEWFRVPRERSPGDAVVFLILALGKICEHGIPLPATAFDPKSDKAEVSTIPGLPYYVRAIEIIKREACCDSLIHAQIFLLAGLYAGQLARVRECVSWFVRAGKVLQKLYDDNAWTGHNDPRQQLEESTNLVTGKPRSLILLASWSCLQLESEILAHVRLPESGIWKLRDRLPMPQNTHGAEARDHSRPANPREDGHLDELLVIFSAQSSLKKLLNQTHNEFHNCACLPSSREQICKILRSHDTTLEEWRRGLSSALKWDDADPPSSNILLARLRAGYWEARYVVNRPFLDYALHIMPYVREGHSVEDASLDAYGDSREASMVHVFEVIRLMDDEEVHAGCRRCVEAAMQSTVALDGVVGRLIMTNVHGTAHA